MKKYIIILSIIFLSLGLNSTRADSYSFSRDLSVGSSGSDVSSLQTFLISNGFPISAIMAGGSKGYFGAQTKFALTAYQRSIGLPAFGYFGRMTRSHLNSDGGRDDSPITLSSPNGGESWVANSTHQISWNYPKADTNSRVDLYLNSGAPCPTTPSQNPIVSYYCPSSSYVLDKNVSNVVYNWITATDINNNQIPAGNYYVRACVAGSNICDQSNSRFTIVASTSSVTVPVINGVDTPTALSVGQMGTWTIRATDPVSGTLNYAVDWGDVPTFVSINCLSGYICEPLGGVMVAPVKQTSTFTHSYSSVGTYTVKFYVRNATELSAQTSSTITVTSTSGPLKVVSPNGGEVWQKGTNQTIIWSAPQYFRATYADLKLSRQYVCTTQACPAIAYAPYTIATGISIDQHSYSWNVGQYLVSYSDIPNSIGAVPDGQYRIQICETGTSNCDSSDQVFTIH
jgi:peptidoglycan hydrolase-like protein with peptidoglycan-binding domain